MTGQTHAPWNKRDLPPWNKKDGDIPRGEGYSTGRESKHLSARLPVPVRQTSVMSMEELQVFLNSSGGLKFNGYSRTETYAWIEKTLRQYKYLARSRMEKDLLRQYLRKVSGYSPAHLTRLIDRFHCSKQVRVRPYRRHCFPHQVYPGRSIPVGGSGRCP